MPIDNRGHDLEIKGLKLTDIRPIHPFPARMAPSIAFDELPTSTKPLRILDPMVGSGTTTVVARARGHIAIGFDTDPLAVLLSKAWSTNVAAEPALELAIDVLENAKGLRKRLRYGYPKHADDPTKAFIDYWFDLESQFQLRALAEVISEVKDAGKRTLLWCGFSRLIITKSHGASLAMDLSHSRPHKVYEISPIEPFEEFISAVKRVIKHSPFQGGLRRLPAARVQRHDARRLPLKDSSIDVVITSPPYLNAIDNVRCSKFSLVWMGYRTSQLQTLRSTNIGSERGRKPQQKTNELESLVSAIGRTRLSVRDSGMLRGYIRDLDRVLSEVSRVLVPKGRAIFVVGDSTVRGTFVRNSEIINQLGGRHGLRLKKRTSRELPPSRRYLPPPTGKGTGAELAERMRREVIMHFTKSR